MKASHVARAQAQAAVMDMYNSHLLSVDCKVDEYGEQVIDWIKFWQDGDVKEAEAIIYLAIRSAQKAQRENGDMWQDEGEECVR